MKVRLFFEWFDMWVGVYWSKESRTLYICPLPMVVLALEFKKSVEGDFEIENRALMLVAQLSLTKDAPGQATRDTLRAQIIEQMKALVAVAKNKWKTS